MTPAERNRWYVAVVALVLQVAIRVAPAIQVPPGIIPVTEHKLDIVIAQEGQQQNSKFGILWNDLRTGSFADYCKQKGHTLEILDKDVTDENGKKIITDADIAGKTLPAVLCYDRATGKLMSGGGLDQSSTVESVMQIVRAAGG